MKTHTLITFPHEANSDFMEITFSISSFISNRCYVFAVSGEANFIMTSTNLTVGGFTQPGVARSLIDIPSNSEKGLSHRFIWLFPNPLFRKFDTLGVVNQNFIEKLRKLQQTTVSPMDFFKFEVRP